MDNVTLGSIALGISIFAFLLVNVLSLQAMLQRRREEREDTSAWLPASAGPVEGTDRG